MILVWFVACVRSTLHRVTEIQNILNGFNLSPQILAHLGSPSDSLVREVLALQNILLLNANRTVQVRAYEYLRTLIMYTAERWLMYTVVIIVGFSLLHK